MQKYIKDMLECPVCHHALEWHITEETEERIVNGEAICSHCKANYPIVNEIAVFLTPDLPRNDLWEQGENYFQKYLKENPEFSEKFMNVPLDTLNPTDLYVRASLMEKDDPIKARVWMKKALKGTYSEDTLRVRNELFDYIVKELPTDEVIVDLACGTGALVEHLAQNTTNPLIATDFSPFVLKKDQQEFREYRDRISFIAFDARRTPFKDGAIKRMTTFVGLANIEEPLGLLNELRRIINGTLYAVNHFFPAYDQAHHDFLNEHHMETFMFEENLIKAFKEANFKVENKPLLPIQAGPTPLGEYFKIRLDGVPICDTTLTWTVTKAQ